MLLSHEREKITPLSLSLQAGFWENGCILGSAHSCPSCRSQKADRLFLTTHNSLGILPFDRRRRHARAGPDAVNQRYQQISIDIVGHYL